MGDRAGSGKPCTPNSFKPSSRNSPSDRLCVALPSHLILFSLHSLAFSPGVPRPPLNPGLLQTLGTAAWQMKCVTSPSEALVAVTVITSKVGVPGGLTKDRFSCSPSRSNTLRFGMGARGGREKQLTVWTNDEFIHSPIQKNLSELPLGAGHCFKC